MYPWLCIRTLDTSHGYVVKNYEKGGEGNLKRGEIFFPIFDTKLINGNTIEDFMQKKFKISLKIKT